MCGTTQLDEDDRILQIIGNTTTLLWGTYGEISERIRHLDATMHGAGFDARISENIVQAMWEK